MINTIKNFTTCSNINNSFKPINRNSRINRSISDTVSFKGQPKFVNKDVLNLVKRLEDNNPVIGFKGDGKWVLPNLRHVAGQRFNLYLPDGKQLSYQKGGTKNSIVFSLKSNLNNETTKSKIRLPEHDEYKEYKRLLKTKTDHVLTFRVSTKDAKPSEGEFKAGQIDVITKNQDGSYKETSNISDNECTKINDMLKEYLPSFF